MNTERTHPALQRAPSPAHAAAALVAAMAIVSGVATAFLDATHDRARAEALLARAGAARAGASVSAPAPARAGPAALVVAAAR